MKRVAAVVSCLLGGGMVCDRVLAQPEPLPEPLPIRYPGSPPNGYADQAVDIGLWQEKVGGSFTPKKVYALGTVRNSSGTYISLAEYNPSGLVGIPPAPGPTNVVFWPPSNAGSRGPSLRSAKAMVIPVVPQNTYEEDGRIYVLGETDAAQGTTDLVVLCFDFKLSLKWSQTYNYTPPSNDAYQGNDTAIAITTDQSQDPLLEPIDYNFVTVLARSDSPTGPVSTTLAFCKNSNTQIMPPKHEAAMIDPVDITVGKDSSCTPAIFITGANGSTMTPFGIGQAMTQCYLVPDLNCPPALVNGATPSGWPKFETGQFTGYPTVWTRPARLKWQKGSLFLAATTGPNTAGLPPPYALPDFLAVSYATCGGNDWKRQFDFKDNLNSGPSRSDYAADMDVPYDTQSRVVITGKTVGLSGDVRVATQAYDALGTAIWSYGAIWPLPVDPAVDLEGVAVKCIPAQDGINASFAFNAYVAAKTLGTNGFDYLTIKYAGTVQTNDY